jgi:hypothetical protein
MLAGGGGGDTVTLFYSDIQIMDLMRISPSEWAGLHRWDKLALRYYLIAKGYREKKAMDKMKEESERKARFNASLPKQKIGKR